MTREKQCNAPEKRSKGRPTLYKAAYAGQAYRLALLGMTDIEMAGFFGVAESTWHIWKLKHKEFSESIKRGKAEADARVAHSLYKAAIGGGTITETKDQPNAEGKIERTTTIKELPANTTAMIFWLKNRQPKMWRDRVEADVTLNGPSSEELSQRYAEIMQKARERQEAVLAERGVESED